MENHVALTGVNVDATMYFAYVVSFDLTSTGTEMPLFRKQLKNV